MATRTITRTVQHPDEVARRFVTISEEVLERQRARRLQVDEGVVSFDGRWFPLGWALDMLLSIAQGRIHISHDSSSVQVRYEISFAWPLIIVSCALYAAAFVLMLAAIGCRGMSLVVAGLFVWLLPLGFSHLAHRSRFDAFIMRSLKKAQKQIDGR
jgi:hypothetical protein